VMTTATEYGLTLALVAVVITGALRVIGSQEELKLNVIKDNTNLALPS
jgi:Flp pilus assembly pilin Flp